MQSDITLSIKDLDIQYSKEVHALKGITLDIPNNKVTALIGASGSGKSSFLRALNRMHDTNPNVAVSGSINYKGSNIYDDSVNVIELRRKIGMVFQHPTPFPKSIYDNVAYGLKLDRQYSKPMDNLKKILQKPELRYKDIENSEDAVDTIVVKSLKEAALWDEVKERLHVSALHLSGGQQQRLCIARSIAVQPDVILLDEPASALDPIATSKIETLIKKLKEQYTVVIVTHNMQQAQRISDYVAFFHLGKLVEFGTTDEIFKTPKQQLTQDYVGGKFG